MSRVCAPHLQPVMKQLLALAIQNMESHCISLHNMSACNNACWSMGTLLSCTFCYCWSMCKMLSSTFCCCWSMCETPSCTFCYCWSICKMLSCTLCCEALTQCSTCCLAPACRGCSSAATPCWPMGKAVCTTGPPNAAFVMHCLLWVPASVHHVFLHHPVEHVCLQQHLLVS